MGWTLWSRYPIFNFELEFINERNKAQVVSKQGGWVTEHIRTAILKFNYEIDKTDGMLVKDFERKHLNEYEKTFSKDV